MCGIWRWISRPASTSIFRFARSIRIACPGFATISSGWCGHSRRRRCFRATFLEHLRNLDPDVAMSGGGSMRASVDAWFAPRRFNLGLFGAFALSAILIAVTGLYGLVAYTVNQRRREIGVRMALGATPGDVVLLVVRQAAMLSVVGGVLGMAIAGVTRGLLAGMTSDVRLSPAAMAIAAAILAGIVLLAAWLPVRRQVSRMTLARLLHD